MTYEEAVEYLKESGRFEQLGFVTDEEISKIEKTMVIQAAILEKRRIKDI